MTQYSQNGSGTRGFGTGSGTIEPVPWNRFLRQITTTHLHSVDAVTVVVFGERMFLGRHLIT